MHSSSVYGRPSAPIRPMPTAPSHHYRTSPPSSQQQAKPRPRDDMDYQRQAVASFHRQQHEKWCAEHQARQRFDHHSNRVRADLIINEARRLEKEHLQHQLQYARDLVRYTKLRTGGSASGRTIGASDATPGPKQQRRNGLGHVDTNTAFASPSGKASTTLSSAPASPVTSQENHQSPQPPRRICGCLTAPLCRQILPKYRALALLKQTFDNDKVDEAWETLRETYASDLDMLEDLIYRYGPEPEDVSPNTRLRCVEEKIADCDTKWRRIGADAMNEMQYRDAYQNVIRNLSIMRIFLEGSQAQSYGCDTTERSRRDAFHQQVLDQLAEQNDGLFITPPRTGRSFSSSHMH